MMMMMMMMIIIIIVIKGEKIKNTVKLALELATKFQRGSRCIAPFVLQPRR